MSGVFDDMPGVRREAVPGPDGYSTEPEQCQGQCGHWWCSAAKAKAKEKPSWTKPVVQIKDSLDEHRDSRIIQLHVRLLNSHSMFNELATVITDLTDRVDVLQMELNRLKRAKG